MEPQKKILSAKDAAEFLGISQFYLYKLKHQGKISCFKPNGGRIYFKTEDLERWIFRNRSCADFEMEASHA